MTASPLPDLGCACAGLRRAARLVTQLYAEEMGAAIEPAQFALLSALSCGPRDQASLGRAFGLDKTTVSRNLQVLRRRGWIEPAPAPDRRERCYRLTNAGSEILEATKPAWTRAQARLRSALGEDWNALLSGFDRVSEAALAAASC
jgi:DNA-binding MarR family transcriptional regulator